MPPIWVKFSVSWREEQNVAIKLRSMGNNAFISFIIKETKHIVRDTRTMVILFGIPLIMMLLFGFAISTDVKNVRIVLVQQNIDQKTQAIVSRLNASEYFTVERIAHSSAEAEEMIRNQKAEMAIVFSEHFAANSANGSAKVQIMVNGTDPNTSQQQVNYARAIIMQELGAAVISVASTRNLYNPQIKSAFNFVPGIMGMLLMLICAMMTSVSIVKEKERGTMEVLLVSPIKPIMIIISKAVPYFILSFIILIAIMLMSHFILGVPMEGNIGAIIALSMLYILLSLALGLLISVIADTQLVALLFSGMVLLMPCIMLSGMMYPIESIPTILQYFSAIVPARWYISAVKKLMIMGVGIDTIVQEVTILTTMTVVIVTVALKKFKTRLE